MAIIIGLTNGSAGGSSSIMNAWYGVRIFKGALANENDRVQRIAGTGYMDLHATLPLQSQMRRCLLRDDGTVNYYLKPTDSTLKEDGTPAVLDGTDGQLMVEIPDTYVKFEEDTNYLYCKLSSIQLPGFTKWKKKYVSACEATVQKTGNKLASVINWTSEYCGGAGNATQANANMLGRPRTGISLTTYRSYAHNRGTGWQCNTYDVQKQLYWFFIVEYATLNSQKAFNGQLTSEGYHQGGVGEGVDNLTSAKWNAYSVYYPVVPCGTTVVGFSDNLDSDVQHTLATNKLGNFSGVATYKFNAGTYDTDAFMTYPNSYRGVENPFAHIWKWTDGLLTRYNDSDHDGECALYTCDNPADYSSSLNSSYKFAGILPSTSVADGYVKEILFDPMGNIMPKTLGAASNTYYCDYYYHNTSAQSQNTIHGVYFGGNANYGASCGFAYASTHLAPSITYASIGSRLCFYPQ